MLAYNVLPTFAHLRGIAWRHAESDEFVRGQGMAAQEQSRLPRRKSDKNQSDQNKQEKGKAVIIDAKRNEAHSGLRTSVGRFLQYTPLVTTVEHVLNQVSGRDCSEILHPFAQTVLGEIRTNTATSTRMLATT
ncbi:hypothetical protein TIFTF001_034394 [Ficus carica]|uniref:Uncharacterized protein n=1 Tax=Ficus carica TaxID=3494 RepID=A0AA88DZU0_FICCA|nr:hypothetical protein TIFTF001_034394 [Ficus carica]